MEKYNLIYLRSGKLILSKIQFESWKKIQELYGDYMTSLNFESIDAVNEFLSLDFKIENETVKKITSNIHFVENDIELEI